MKLRNGIGSIFFPTPTETGGVWVQSSGSATQCLTVGRFAADANTGTTLERPCRTAFRLPDKRFYELASYSVR